MPKLLFVLLCLLWSLVSLGQEKIEWLHENQLSKTGFYKNHGFTQSPINLGIVFSNQDKVAKTQYLKINNPHVNVLTLKRLNGDTLYHTGDHQIFSSRPVFFWDFILPITTLPGKTDSLMLELDNAGETQVYNLSLLAPDHFERKRLGDTFFFGTVVAFSLIFSVAFLLLGLYKHEKTNIVFSIYIVVSVLWILNINGILFQLIWPNRVFIQHAARIITSSLSITAFVYYFVSFYKDHMTRFAKTALRFFMVMLLLRMVPVLGIPDLLTNSKLKYGLLIFGTSVIIIGLFILFFYLLKFFSKGRYLFHNIGFAINFIFVIKEGVKLTGVDIFPFPAHDEYVSAITHFIIIGFFSISNIQQYRYSKQQQILKELDDSHKKDIEMTEKIIDAQEYERSTIGKNIHDQVGGLLAVMKIKMQTIKLKRNDVELNQDIEQFIGIVDQCSNDLHNIVDDLIPPEFELQDLSSIIKERIRLFKTATGIAIHYQPQKLNISQQAGLRIYRIICELITNAIKHAQCNEIQLALYKKDGILYIGYKDNGIGIDPEKVKLKHGVNNILSRIKFMEGSVETNSIPGETSYSITIPLANT